MRRRKFICGLAAALCAPSISKAVQPDKIKIGQIGLAHPHARGKLTAIRSLAGEYELVGVVEPDAVRRKSVRGVKFIGEEELLNTKGLQAVAESSEVTVHSDSQYVVNTMTRNWKRNANKDLWIRLDAEVDARRDGHGFELEGALSASNGFVRFTELRVQHAQVQLRFEAVGVGKLSGAVFTERLCKSDASSGRPVLGRRGRENAGGFEAHRSDRIAK